MKTIREYALLGEGYDIMDALKFLTQAYISQCGVSLGYRTIVYDAAESWQERLAWLDLPLSEMARKESLVCIMPFITSEYDPEKYDKYDITGMDEKELSDGCKQIIQEKIFDEATTEVLSWGLLKALERFEPLEHNSKIIKVVSSEGTPLKGILTKQQCCNTSIIMQQPYPDVWLYATELVRDARELLLKGYDDYHWLRSMENEIMSLYPKYQKELEKRKNESNYRKMCIFDDIYGPLVKKTVLLMPEKLIHEWFGLKFYNY